MMAAMPLDIAIVVLAAGRARRMGVDGPHKLLAAFDGVPLLRRVVLRAIAADVASVSVVTGHRAEDMAGVLGGLPVEIVFNPDHADGMSSSLKAGLAAVSARQPDGLLVMLADMPEVTTAHLDALAGAFRAAGGRSIVRAADGGRRGNPVILPSVLFPALMTLQGDVGAREVIDRSALAVIDVEIGPAAHMDVDTVAAVLAAGGKVMD